MCKSHHGNSIVTKICLVTSFSKTKSFIFYVILRLSPFDIVGISRAFCWKGAAVSRCSVKMLFQKVFNKLTGTQMYYRVLLIVKSKVQVWWNFTWNRCLLYKLSFKLYKVFRACFLRKRQFLSVDYHHKINPVNIEWKSTNIIEHHAGNNLLKAQDFYRVFSVRK